MELIFTGITEFFYRTKVLIEKLYSLFEGDWWKWILRKIGVEKIANLALRCQNELNQANTWNAAIIDYRPYYSKEKIHWLFEDPLHKCEKCRKAVRLLPTAKNLLLAKLKIGKYKNALFMES
jgi:hypothetical protein